MRLCYFCGQAHSESVPFCSEECWSEFHDKNPEVEPSLETKPSDDPSPWEIFASNGKPFPRNPDLIGHDDDDFDDIPF